LGAVEREHVIGSNIKIRHDHKRRSIARRFSAIFGRMNVIFELQRIGAYAKMTAIDTDTGLEVSVVGPAMGHVESLKRTALAKLKMRLEQGAQQR
jgi:hypothetical protein